VTQIHERDSFHTDRCRGEGIGLALDLKGGRMFITDFGGSVNSANINGSNRT